jgi:hypothetical protein
MTFSLFPEAKPKDGFFGVVNKKVTGGLEQGGFRGCKCKHHWFKEFLIVRQESIEQTSKF